MTKDDMAAAKAMLDKHFGEKLWQEMTERERKDTAKGVKQSGKSFDQVNEQILAIFEEIELTPRNSVLIILSCVVEAYHTNKLNGLSDRCFNYMEQQRRHRKNKEDRL